jgi:acyl-CoA thioesterase-2
MPKPVVAELIDLLKLERLEENLFRGQSRDIGTKYVFGGQVLGQALSAAQQTVIDARQVHSLHAYFLRAGDIEAPIVYEVDRARDGKSFSTRRVVAIQHGEPIFNMGASFQVSEPGVEHQLSMPEVPKPEDLEVPEPIPPEQLSAISATLQRWLLRLGPFEFRYVYPRDEIKVPKRPPFQQVWFRLADRHRRRPGAAPGVAGLRLRLSSDRHRDLPARDLLPPAQRADGQPRPRHVVPPPVPRGRVAAVLVRQPVRPGRARAWRAA